MRDAVALLLLVVSFGLPWDGDQSVTDHVWAVIATLLAIVSLALPYLRVAGGVLPRSWGPPQVRLTRLLLNVPYVVVVAVALVLGYLGGDGRGAGVGVGIAVGLGGALLAAQPRRAELVGQRGAAGGLWRGVLLVLLVLHVVGTLLALLLYVLDVGGDAGWVSLVLLVGIHLLMIAVPGLAVVGLLRGHVTWRDAVVLVGVAGLLAALWLQWAELTLGGQWSLRRFGPAILLWPASGVVAASPAVAGVLRPEAGARRWIGTATRALELAVVVAAFAVVLPLVALFDEGTARAPQIAVVVLQLIALAAALVARNALRGDPRTGRAVALVVAGVLLAVAIVQAAVLGAAEDVAVGFVDVVVLTVEMVAAAAVATLVLGPQAVRAELGPLASAGHGGPPGWGPQHPTGQPPRGPQATGSPPPRTPTQPLPPAPQWPTPPPPSAGQAPPPPGPTG